MKQLYRITGFLFSKINIQLRFKSSSTIDQNFIKKLQIYFVLDKTLKGMHGVRLDNLKVLRAPGLRTKYFDRFFIVQ